MNEITLYITLSPKLEAKEEKDIVTFIRNSLQNNNLMINSFEPYEEFAYIGTTSFKNKQYEVLVGPVAGEKKNEWVVALLPPKLSLLNKLLKSDGNDRVKEYKDLLTILQKAFSSNKDVIKVVPYEEKDPRFKV